MPKTLFVGSTKAGQTRVEDSPFYGTIPNPSVQKEGILSVAVADDGAITPGAFFPLDTHIGWIERHPTNGLLYGGSTDGMACLRKRGSAEESHREAVRAWLAARPEVSEANVGPLIDVWYLER